jgi:hypothetical protein
MVLIPVLCPYCQSDQVIKGGKTKASIQLPKLGRSMPFSSISRTQGAYPRSKSTSLT